MRKYANVVLAAVIAVSLFSGAWLIASPTLEKQDALNKQNELLLGLENIQPVASLEPTTSTFPAETSEPTTITIPKELPEPTEPPTEPAPTSVLEMPFTPPSDPMEGIGVLAIEKLDLKLPVVYGVTEEQLKIAVGFVPQTVPIGNTGNAVIAGHRNYDYGSMFNRLGEMEAGDIITYTPKDGEAMTFGVFEVTVIEPGDQIAFIQPKNEAIITLYTCTPVREATHRLLVRAAKK